MRALVPFLQTLPLCSHYFLQSQNNMASYSTAESLEFQALHQVKPYQEEEFTLELVDGETQRCRKRKL